MHIGGLEEFGATDLKAQPALEKIQKKLETQQIMLIALILIVLFKK